MTILRRQGRALVVAVVMMAVAGCASNAGWSYQPNPPQLTATHVPLTLAVEHFKDQRGTQNSRYFWVCIIPLVPYCSSSYQRPDTANGFLTEAAYNFRPSADLANAAALEIKQDDIFHEVFVTDRDMDPSAQLILRGTIINTNWDGSEYTYLLGPYGALPWLFGAPIGTAENTLNLRLELLQQSNGAVLWTDEINQNYSKTEGIYYNFAMDFGYPEMFRDGMRQAVTSLEQYVASQPLSFWQAMKPAAPSANPTK
ncbi:MAG TPA: hypothetical protein VMV27_15680 [Candidatus Binataceae bacterium]|nr:hypothetical protein [Candidatus Binataceae bacterium]